MNSPRVTSARKRIGESEGQDPVRRYLHDISRFAMLTHDEEVLLGQRIEAGKRASRALSANAARLPERERLRRAIRAGADAREMFVQANLRLVVSIAKHYRTSSLALLDLIQEGNLGLIDAVETFDWRPGFRFSTYATPRIRHAISRAIANTDRSIRLPVHASDTLVGVQRARARLEPRLRRPATIVELAAEADLPADKVAEVLVFEPAPVSLSEPTSPGSSSELGTLLEDRTEPSPFEAMMRSVLALDVAAMLRGLDGRERQVILSRFGLDQDEGACDEQNRPCAATYRSVRKIEQRALSKLRLHPAYDKAIKLLLDT
jgi:RNA polymerase sigma factor (sigma-70 family)